ncbi:MAG TPA: low specificity L-threonine aldolase, partial [Acidobacteria bacterium]|nr:low specificity L-threonine aldolase [Acidobacteriota bacterium]
MLIGLFTAHSPYAPSVCHSGGGMSAGVGVMSVPVGPGGKPESAGGERQPFSVAAAFVSGTAVRRKSSGATARGPGVESAASGPGEEETKVPEAMKEAMVVDLRSDTVTRPTEAMRQAMARAEVGDDVYDEDPTVIELERLAAGLTGKEAGLFVPSGSMANLIAQMVHADRGSEVVLGEASHAVLYEVGAGAAIAGVQYSIIPGDGRFTAGQVRERIKAPTFHTPGTSLIWVENTHNMGGGTIFPTAEIKAIAEVAHEAGLPLHMDGARVFNAVVAGGEALRDVVREVDSLSFCLS